jgi:hypothetical protein
VTATLDYYEDSDATFTFNRASTAPSEILKSFDQSEKFKSAWLDDEQIENKQVSEGDDFVCTHNRCFKGMALGIPCSILLWAGIILASYAVF